METDAILFDEPTSALDPQLFGEVPGVLRALANEGLTMVVEDHGMGFALDVADGVLFLDAGTMVEPGPAVEILSRPQNPRMQSFLRRVFPAGSVA